MYFLSNIRWRLPLRKAPNEFRTIEIKRTWREDFCYSNYQHDPDLWKTEDFPPSMCFICPQLTRSDPYREDIVLIAIEPQNSETVQGAIKIKIKQMHQYREVYVEQLCKNPINRKNNSTAIWGIGSALLLSAIKYSQVLFPDPDIVFYLALFCNENDAQELYNHLGMKQSGCDFLWEAKKIVEFRGPFETKYLV